MSLAQFRSKPTESTHDHYERSSFKTAAPEYATGEVLLSSVYRRLLLRIHDNVVDLARIGVLPGQFPPGLGHPQMWSLVMERGGLGSPLRSGQRDGVLSRQLMPLVPEIGHVAGVLGAKGRRRWFPGNLAVEVIGAGVGPAIGPSLIRKFGEALSVSSGDDLIARFLSQSLNSLTPPLLPAQPPAPYEALVFEDSDIVAFRGVPGFPRGGLTPAERFCIDLESILKLKGKLTRRQWTVLVEAMLRLGLAMHVLWVCQLNELFWGRCLDVASGAQSPDAPTIQREIWESHRSTAPLLELGSNAEAMLKRTIGRYVYARVGINFLLHHMEDQGIACPGNCPLGYSPSNNQSVPDALATFLSHLSTHRLQVEPSDPGKWLRSEVSALVDQSDGLRALVKCGRGFSKNLYEFSRHSLGQIKAADAEDKAYDQSYLIAFPGARKPLPVQPGPAMLITLVHACSSDKGLIPASLEDFRRHLADYGLRVPAGHLVAGRAGKDLANLGLVVDSPDAAGGRLLVRPFG